MSGRISAVVLVLSGIAAAQTPPASEAILRRAIQLHQSGAIEDAVKEYRAYLKESPGNLMARSNLGAALSRLGRYEDAIAEYDQALKADPGNLPVRVNLALAYYKTARIPTAAEHLAAVVARQPSNRQAVILLADCRLQMGEDKKVIELLEPLEKETPDDKSVIYLLGTAYIRDKQPERGQVLVNRILKDGDSAEARLLLGITRMNAQEFAEALVDLQKAVELNPKLPDVYSYYGLALLATGDMNGAAEAFRKELEFNPNDFVSNLQLGVVLKQDEQYDKARAFFDRALRVRPGDPGVLYQVATLDLLTGSVEAARIKLEQLVKDTPHFVEAHVSLATVYYRLKRKADGDRERELVLKLNAESQAAQPAAKAP
jgi:tetratricopeptide (TPR) repeat protein